MYNFIVHLAIAVSICALLNLIFNKIGFKGYLRDIADTILYTIAAIYVMISLFLPIF